MMRTKIIVYLFLSLAFGSLKAQVTVNGKVANTNSSPLEGVSIQIKDSYEGTTSATDGSFSFQLPDSGHYVIVYSLLGYKTLEKDVHVIKNMPLISIVLKAEISEMDAVVVTAGTFEASDKKRNTVFRSVDVLTTAGQQADVVAALKTLPGAQQVGEQEGLFVRGGTGNETKTFVDGLMVSNPFFSSVPGIAQRSRFSPLLFKGTVFSSGGYSALYGQGLSAALILESIDLPSRSEVNLILSSAQLSFMSQKLNEAKNASIGLNINYSNLAPYFNVVAQKYRYDKAPEALNAEFNWRQKTKRGIFKTYAYLSKNTVSFERPNLDHVIYTDQFRINNEHLFTTTTYTGKLNHQWSLYSGVSLSLNQDKIDIKTGNKNIIVMSFTPALFNSTAQSKMVLTKTFAGLTRLYLGAEYQYIQDQVEAKDSIAFKKNHDHYIAGFIETDIYFSMNLVSKLGIRQEFSSILRKMVISPRISLAYKVAEKSQFSFAYGMFFQKPETNYLFRNDPPGFSRATHLVFNFQRIAHGRTFRIESFQKKYSDLITTSIHNVSAIGNNGSGYSRGIEVFWRDKTTIKNLDYWVSYSLLDTKRKYLDFPKPAHPSFAAKHTLNVVAKRWVNAVSTHFSATYSHATGRPYFNPNREIKDFMSDKTKSYHSLGLQANYLKTFGKVNAVFIANVSNSLGSKQVFGYRYANHADVNGNFKSEAVTPMAKRFVFIGAYLSIGSDSRKNIID